MPGLRDLLTMSKTLSEGDGEAEGFRKGRSQRKLTSDKGILERIHARMFGVLLVIHAARSRSVHANLYRKPITTTAPEKAWVPSCAGMGGLGLCVRRGKRGAGAIFGR